MSRFTVKRSLKQLYIEKHAVEYLIAKKKANISVNDCEPTVRVIADLQSEVALLKEIIKDIEQAEEVVKRNIADM